MKTPYIKIDLEEIVLNFQCFAQEFPSSELLFSMKACPVPEVLETLIENGSGFECSSLEEIEMLLALGIDGKSILYGNPIKKRSDVKRAADIGIRRFSFDSEDDLLNIISMANSPELHCRVKVAVSGAAWPLNRKFGSPVDEAITLISKAHAMGQRNIGISFHVGSQQENENSWSEAIQSFDRIFSHLNDEGIKIQFLNIGGGFPSKFKERDPFANVSLRQSSRKIENAIKEIEQRYYPIKKVILEVGRSFVASSGTLYSEVIKVTDYSDEHWVYIDSGVFNGFFEAVGESLKFYPDPVNENKVRPCILAGPTCDSFDILYPDSKVPITEGVKPGDILKFKNCGAYNYSYAMSHFNGYKPIGIKIVDARLNESGNTINL